MPAGLGWDQGVRHGMEVVLVDGIPVPDLDGAITSIQPEKRAKLLTSNGDVLQVEATQNRIGQSPMKYSLWATGAIFALLGAAVLVRRPDFHAARLFAIISALAAIALAVAPAAGGSGAPWALITMALCTIGIGAIWPPLSFALLEEPSGPHKSTKILIIFLVLGFFLTIAYGAAVLVNSSIYNIYKPAFLSYFSLSLLGAVGLMAVRGIRQESFLSREQVRICLWGTALGILPFVCFTLIPEALGYKEIIPSHINVLALIFIPAFFAYAILQHQLMGIRRLVHRGMVYGISTLVLFIAVSLILVATISVFTEADSDSNLYYFLIPVILVGGIILFSPLRRGIRRLIDRFLYQDTVDYQSALGIVPQYLLVSGGTSDIANVISQRLTRVLSLESALIFLGHSPAEVKLAAKVGEKAGEISTRLEDKIKQYLENPGSQNIVELRLESDSLLFAHLASSGHYLGYMILGPKHAGEVFMEEEKQLLATLIPIISLVFDKAELSDELRGLSQRLIKAEEKERARIAGDLHDGPLQKAAFLVSAIGTDLEDQRSYANQLVAELREICSSLRPAILSDLGLVPALEWLLDNNARRHEISPQLILHNVDEEDRFPPEIEDTLFRIAQESINNTIKHAQATSLELSLSREDGNVLLHVTDNGVGFQTASRDKKKYGLPGMRERAIQIGGSFDVHSALGRGTTVVVNIPIEPYANHNEGDINGFIN
ncbi:sensor histidine kinase [Chloroflexota bacterium]